MRERRIQVTKGSNKTKATKERKQKILLFHFLNSSDELDPHFSSPMEPSSGGRQYKPATFGFKKPPRISSPKCFFLESLSLFKT